MKQHHPSYVRERLGRARHELQKTDQPIKDRLERAFLHGISAIPPDWIPEDDVREEFEAIWLEFTRYSEALPNTGDVATTVWTMSDEDAEALAARTVALADRYLLTDHV